MPTLRVRRGLRGEELARQLLLDKGYYIQATNYRCRWGEVDIVAREGEELVFVEVRTRHSEKFGIPEESLTPAKLRRLMVASQDYLQQHGVPETNWRIDLVSIVFGPERQLQRIDHLRHAVEIK